MIKAVIFDCFGVLVGRGFAETYKAAGGDPVADHDFIEDLLGQANLGLINQAEFHERLTKHLGLSLADYRRVVEESERQNVPLLHYINDLAIDTKPLF